MIYLGPVPGEESCEQIGKKYDAARARKECEQHIAQIKRQLGAVPDDAKLTIKTERHDFGNYYEVVFTAESEASYEYGLQAEKIREWDDEAKKELGLWKSQ